MTTITISRAIVEQALEAMDKATRFMSDADYRKLNEAITALRAALAQQAEPVEPVAWGVDWGRDGDRSCVSITKKRADGTMEVVAVEYGPLYTAPPQRKPLTEEEIERICMTYQSPRQAARAIERAHGIKE